MGIYEELGVKRVINASGTLTVLGGSLMEQGTLEAMNEAAKSFVNMAELAEKAGNIVAEATGAEDGLVTSGAAASLALAAAACITGKDLAKIDKLPDTDGMKNEIIIQRMHRNTYDRCLRISGAKFVEVGDRSHTLPWEMEAAISENTAAIVYFVYGPQPGVLPLEEVIEIAHKRNIPVIVDAAAEIPPVENLKKYIKIGADLVLFSGGKGILGPSNSGLLCGKRELMEAAALNGYPTIALRYPPDHPYFSGKFGIGRAMKISKEQIVGLVTALKSCIKKDHKSEMERWTEMAEYMAKELNALPNVETKVTLEIPMGPRPVCIPKTEVSIDEKALGLTVSDIVNALKEGNPEVAVITNKEAAIPKNRIYLSPQCLFNGEEKVVVKKLKKILTSQRDS